MISTLCVARNASAQVNFRYTPVSSAYETNCPMSTYTASGCPAQTLVDVDASATFKVYNIQSVAETARTQNSCASGLDTNATPQVDVFDTDPFDYYGVYDQIIAPMSYGDTQYTGDCYANGEVTPGSYLANAGFVISDIKTGDSYNYVMAAVNVSVLP
jgi:hypothetical protein